MDRDPTSIRQTFYDHSCGGRNLPAFTAGADLNVANTIFNTISPFAAYRVLKELIGFQ